MFEIEKMEQQFDYSLVDSDTADFLRSCEYEINGIAEDARVKFGKVLIKAREKLANHHGGVFQKWYESGGLDRNNVYYYMNLYESSINLENSQRENFLKAPKTVQKEVMKKNTPNEIKEAVLSGEVKTNKEIEELKKQLNQQKQQNATLQQQLEQAENKEPEVIERYSVPDDYEEMKEKLSELHIERADLRSRLHNLHMTEKEREEKSRKYDELNEAINAMDMKLSDDQLRFKNRKFVNDLLMQSRILMRDVTPLIYTIDSLHEDDLNQMSDSLENLAKELYKISSDIKKQLNRGVVINE